MSKTFKACLSNILLHLYIVLAYAVLQSIQQFEGLNLNIVGAVSEIL